VLLKFSDQAAHKAPTSKTNRLLGCFLLVGNSFLLPFAGTGIVLGLLTTKGQPDTVTDPTVATDIHQSFDVHLNFGTQSTFNLVIIIDDITDGGQLVVVPGVNLKVLIHASFLKDLLGSAAANTINVGKADHTSFIPGDVNSSYTCHMLFSLLVFKRLSLTLLKLGILLVDYVNSSLATHNLALGASFLYRHSDFHYCGV
jgi:hypothetical protein